MTKVIYDPFVPQFSTTLEDKKPNSQYRHELRLNQPVRRVDFYGTPIYLIQGITYSPALGAFMARKMVKREVVLNSTKAANVNTPKQKIAEIIIALTRSYLEATKKLDTSKDKNNNISISLMVKKNLALWPTLRVQFSSEHGQNVAKVLGLDKLTKYENLMVFIAQFNEQVMAFKKYGGKHFEFDENAKPVQFNDIDVQQLSGKLTKAFDRYFLKRSIEIPNVEGGVNSAGNFNEYLGHLRNALLEAKGCIDKPKPIESTDIVNRPQRTTGVPGV